MRSRSEFLALVVLGLIAPLAAAQPFTLHAEGSIGCSGAAGTGQPVGYVAVGPIVNNIVNYTYLVTGAGPSGAYSIEASEKPGCSPIWFNLPGALITDASGSGSVSGSFTTTPGDHNFLFIAVDNTFSGTPWRELGTTDARPAVTVVGTGCAGMAGVAPMLGTGQIPTLGNPTFTVDVTQALPSSVAFLFGSLGLASSPTGLGAGCNLYLEPVSLEALVSAGVLPLARPTSASGAASFVVGIPATWTSGTNLALQAAIADPGAVLGFTVTNALDLQIY